jgi:hypothetical protein
MSSIWVVALGAIAILGQPARDARMTSTERAELIERLQKTEKELLELVTAVSDAQWSFKPAPERWSIAEVVEHNVLAEALLFDTAVQSLDRAENPAWDATLAMTETLRRALPNRSRRVDAPAAIRPKQALSRADLMARYAEQRTRALAYVRDTDRPVKAHTAPNPFFGDLNVHQWLLYIPLHNERHNQQIAEVKTSPGYPR